MDDQHRPLCLHRPPQPTAAASRHPHRPGPADEGLEKRRVCAVDAESRRRPRGGLPQHAHGASAMCGLSPAFAAPAGVPLRAARHDAPSAVRLRMGCAPRGAAPVSRRAALAGAAAALAAAALAPHARAAMYSNTVKSTGRYASATDPKITLPDLMPQINDGYAALLDLQTRWEEKTAALDGDVVRRVLGTVGVTSPLFNIRKTFLRAWKLIADSGNVDEEIIDDLESAWNGVLDGISSIDFQVYSVGYTELLETKLNLLEKSKGALDNTLELYRQFLKDIPKSML